MNKDITQNDLLLYSYSELTEPRLSQVQNAIKLDPALQMEYSEILNMQAHLDSVLLSPAETVLQIILEESSSSALEVC